MTKTQFDSFQDLVGSVRWLRGMSAKQLSCVCNLLHALRDDIAQATTYRVERCLSILGLRPMLNSKQIKKIMGLSQNNDLAFLWFIWEAHYRKPLICGEEHKYKYSMSEQLILSAIAHLDMSTTMRGLDKILPAPEYSKKYQEIEHEKKLRQSKEQVKKLIQRMSQRRDKNARNCKRVSNQKVLPYLVPQVRPKQYRPTPKKSVPPELKVTFPCYENYKDKMFQIPNESSRWFTNYELNPLKREIKRCVSDILNRVLDDHRMPVDKSTCNIHRMLEHSKARKEQELIVKTLQQCMRIIDIENTNRAQRREVIVRKLEEAVECAAEQMRQYTRRQLVQLQQIIGGDCSRGNGCQMCGKLGNLPPLFDQKADLSILLDIDFNVASHPMPDEMHPDYPVKVLELGQQKQIKLVPVDKEVKLLNALGINAYCNPKNRKEDKARCPGEGGVIKILNSKGEIARRIQPSEIPFCPPERCSSVASQFRYCSRRTMKNGLLQWDYFKVFEPVSDTGSYEFIGDRVPFIRTYAVAALNRPDDANDQSTNRTRPQLGITAQSTVDAAEKCAIDIIDTGARVMGNNIDSPTDCKADTVCFSVTHQKLHNIKSIDPEDVPTLLQLLKDAIDIMKRDPHYVLITLPNVHLMPTLLNWVAERYGKTYNIQQMHDLARSTRLICEQLTKQQHLYSNVPLPQKNKFVGPHRCIEPYDKRESFVCRVKNMQDDYFNRLNKKALAMSRNIWFGLRCHTNFGGSLASPYFAYMPAKESDFLRHYIWQSYDYRPVACYRKDRQKRTGKLC